VELSVKTARQGNKIIELHYIVKSFDNQQVVNNFYYIFKKGDRIGLAGKNGTGKSTLLNLITGGLQPDKGEIIKGETTVFGYFHQSGITFKEDERVIDVVKNVAEFITMGDGKTITASALLTLFLFPPNKQYGFIANLSGGEKKRLQLMSILMKNPNFLILDEPTNDLDIDTLNVLEEFLTNYGGVLMMVSHDRYLLDKLTDQLFIMEGKGNVRIYNGNYSSYRLEQEESKQIKKAEPVVTTQSVKKTKLSYKETKELETLESEIAGIEEKIKQCNEKLNVAGIEPNKLNGLLGETDRLTEELDNKTSRWLELSELKES
jgi:ATP-binding cassette subfamily F protein uup